MKMKTNDPNKLALLESLKGGLIVSCQTQKDEPIYTEDMVVKMAECAKWGGAVGLRLNSPEQIRKVKEANLGYLSLVCIKFGTRIQMYLLRRR